MLACLLSLLASTEALTAAAHQASSSIAPKDTRFYSEIDTPPPACNSCPGGCPPPCETEEDSQLRIAREKEEQRRLNEIEKDRLEKKHAQQQQAKHETEHKSTVAERQAEQLEQSKKGQEQDKERTRVAAKEQTETAANDAAASQTAHAEADEQERRAVEKQAQARAHDGVDLDPSSQQAARERAAQDHLQSHQQP